MRTPLGLILLVLIGFRGRSLAQEFVLSLYEQPPSAPTGETEQEKVVKTDITRISNVRNPTIAVYLPSKRLATGQAIVICPGGGYQILAYDLEGTDIARYLNSIGVAAVVLKYRLPVSCGCPEPWHAPLDDARRAMRLVRRNAGTWNIDPGKVGVMGFSAGGHLASTLGTHFDRGDPDARDPVERESCRPDFMALIYPVISFVDPSSHAGSREALLGKNPDTSLLTSFSSELQVHADTPPAFLVHASDDETVPVRNSLLMYEALHSKRIPVEMHILTEGGHGFGLGLGNPHVGSWTENLRLWLRAINHAG